jgi:hypothetical protein
MRRQFGIAPGATTTGCAFDTMKCCSLAVYPALVGGRLRFLRRPTVEVLDSQFETGRGLACLHRKVEGIDSHG